MISAEVLFSVWIYGYGRVPALVGTTGALVPAYILTRRPVRGDDEFGWGAGKTQDGRVVRYVGGTDGRSLVLLLGLAWLPSWYAALLARSVWAGGAVSSRRRTDARERKRHGRREAEDGVEDTGTRSGDGWWKVGAVVIVYRACAWSRRHQQHRGLYMSRLFALYDWQTR